MDIYEEEIICVWKALSDNDVEYIIIGNYAVSLYGSINRITPALDIWIDDTKKNRAKLCKAFADCGIGDYLMLETMEIIPGFANFYLKNGLRIDLFVNMKGIEKFTFNECLQLATIADIENIQVPFLHINHLVANKKAVNRPKDQLDVIELEKIIQLRKEMGLD